MEERTCQFLQGYTLLCVFNHFTPVRSLGVYFVWVRVRARVRVSSIHGEKRISIGNPIFGSLHLVAKEFMVRFTFIQTPEVMRHARGIDSAVYSNRHQTRYTYFDKNLLSTSAISSTNLASILRARINEELAKSNFDFFFLIS